MIVGLRGVELDLDGRPSRMPPERPVPSDEIPICARVTAWGRLDPIFRDESEDEG